MRTVVYLLLIFSISNGISAFAQDRYAVYFTDKNSSPYSISSPQDYLSARSLARKSRLGIPIDERDLPVNPSYRSDIESVADVDVFYSSRWLNAVLVQATTTSLAELESMPFVDRVEFLAPGAPLNPGGRTDLREGKYELEEETAVQNDLLGIGEMHNDGYRGMGILIAHIDIGYPGVNTAAAFSHLYPDGVVDTYDFVSNNPDVYSGNSHGTRTLGVISGYVPGEITGAAWQADVCLYITEDLPSEYRVEEFYWALAAERADSTGADLISSSLGYYVFDDPSMDYLPEDLDGATAMITRASNTAVEKGMMVVTSAGNEGNKVWSRITFPSDCFECLAVGALTPLGEKATFSSSGPSADGRIKPDLMALGVGVRTLEPDATYVSLNGTSLSAPAVSGLLAGLMQRFPDRGPVELADILKKSASNAADPDFQTGYGYPHYRAVLNYLQARESEIPVAVYPNPARAGSGVEIQLFDPGENAAVHLEVYTATGQFHSRYRMEYSWLNYRAELDLSEWNAGVYILVIHSPGFVLKRRLVVQN